MKIYAQLNENNICTAISQLSGEVIQENLIEVSNFSQEYMWKKYDKTLKEWSVEKYEPGSTAPITEFEALKKESDTIKTENAELMMKSAITDMEIETVKNENAEMMFRLANLEMGGML